jgi:hypothetical protein
VIKAHSEFIVTVAYPETASIITSQCLLIKAPFDAPPVHALPLNHFGPRPGGYHGLATATMIFKPFLLHHSILKTVFRHLFD